MTDALIVICPKIQHPIAMQLLAYRRGEYDPTATLSKVCLLHLGVVDPPNAGVYGI